MVSHAFTKGSSKDEAEAMSPLSESDPKAEGYTMDVKNKSPCTFYNVVPTITTVNPLSGCLTRKFTELSADNAHINK
jgi:hypothetical protein